MDTPALPEGSWPICLNIAKATGTTSWESLQAPVRTVTVEWPQDGALLWTTHLSFSTRRQMSSGDSLYVHPQWAAGGWGTSEVFNPYSAQAVQQTAITAQQQAASGPALMQHGGTYDESGITSFGPSAGFTPDELNQSVADPFKAQQGGGD